MKCFNLLALLAPCVIFASAGRADDAATRPAQGGAEERAQKVAELTKAVTEAKDPPSAAAAYARANAIDSANVKLHESYMVRMLKFGLPKIALYPARSLVRLDPNHVLAWSVIGYVHGTNGELVEAFDATIRAVRNLEDNPAVLNNAGQLVAWYDNEPDLPEVSAASRRWLEKLRDDLGKQELYVKAYERVAAAYKQRAASIDEYNQKLPAAEAAVNTLRQQLAAAEAEYRAMADEINSRARLIDNLRRELFYYYYWGTQDPYTDRHNYYRRRREELRDRIREEQRAIDQLREQIYRLRAAAETIRGELSARENTLTTLNEELERAAGQVYKRFRWDPPAIDGVITPEVERFVYSEPKRGTATDDPEVLAAQRLKVARLYIRHKLPEKALEILTEIVTNYGQTKAAEEAKSLLDVMKLEKE